MVKPKPGNKNDEDEFGGWLGTLFIILSTPASLIFVYIICNENQCSFFHIPPLQKYFEPSTYFHLPSMLVVVGYLVSVAVLSLLPFGGRKVTGMPTKEGVRLEYFMNGVFTCIVLVAVEIGLEIKGIPVYDFVTKNIFHLLIATITAGFSLTFYAYIRSFFMPLKSLNTKVIGKNPIYCFFLGRELNPRIFNRLDLKLYVMRVAVIGAILLDLLCLYKSFGIGDSFDLKTLHFHPTLIVQVVIHFVYCFDSIMYEAATVTTFEIQDEAFGYTAGLGYLIYPFITISMTKCVIDYNINLATWILVAISIVFIVGMTLFRGSNNQKNAFKRNPHNPKFSNLETIPTSRGTKLLASGYWGFVRHPNYLGDILITLSFGVFVVFLPPVIFIVSIVSLLIHRTVRDNNKCKRKYGTAWDQYCKKIKYVLVPKIY